MIRSVIALHGGKEQCIFIGLTQDDVEHLAKGNGLRYTPADMVAAGMPPEHQVSVAFVYGESHEEIIGYMTEAAAEAGKQVETVYEKPPRRPGAPTSN